MPCLVMVPTDATAGTQCHVMATSTSPCQAQHAPLLFSPLQGLNGLEASTWGEAFAAIQAAASGVKGSEMKAIAGKLADAESMLVLKDLMNRLGCGNLVHEAVRDWPACPPGPLALNCIYCAQHAWHQTGLVFLEV